MPEKNAFRSGVPEPLLTTGEVAALFRVDPKTVSRWAKDNRLFSLRTLGGHRRYRQAEVHALLYGARSSSALHSPRSASCDQ
jgi:excisionase family DNA binding protein